MAGNDRGDSWQLAAFVAHAVLVADDCSLCREVEGADLIVCLSSLVDLDGQAGDVGQCDGVSPDARRGGS